MRNWLPVLILAVLVILWIGGIFLLIGDRPRTWDYGATPYIPAESRFSTQPPSKQDTPPRQIPEIPQPAEKGEQP